MGAAAVGELGIGKSESKKRAAELEGTGGCRLSYKGRRGRS